MNTEEKLTSEMDLETDVIELEKTRRRSSILKPPKQRNPFSAIEVTECVADNTMTKARRVSFASSNYVKPFSADPEKNTIWDNTYEEEINHTDSKNSDLIDTISNIHQTQTNIEMSKVTTFYEKTMEFTNIEKHSVINNQTCNSMVEISSGSVMSFAKKKKAEFGLRVLAPEPSLVDSDKENTNIVMENKENVYLSQSHAKTVYFDDCTMEVTAVHNENKSTVNELVNNTKIYVDRNKTLLFGEFNTKSGDMEMTLNTGQNEKSIKSDSLSPHCEKGFSKTACLDEPSSMELTTVVPPNILKVPKSKFEMSVNLQSNNITQSNTVCAEEPSSMEFTTVIPTNILKVNTNEIKTSKNELKKASNLQSKSNITQIETTCYNEPSPMEFTAVIPPNILKANLGSDNTSETMVIEKSSNMEFTAVVPSRILRIPNTELETCRNSQPNDTTQSKSVCIADPSCMELTTVVSTNIIKPPENEVGTPSSLSFNNMPQNGSMHVEGNQWCENMEMTCGLEKSLFEKSVYEPLETNKLINSSRIASLQTDAEKKENIVNEHAPMAAKSPFKPLSIGKRSKDENCASIAGISTCSQSNTDFPDICRNSNSEINISRSPTFRPLSTDQHQDTPEIKCKNKEDQSFKLKIDKNSRLSRSPSFVPIEKVYMDKDAALLLSTPKKKGSHAGNKGQFPTKTARETTHVTSKINMSISDTGHLPIIHSEINADDNLQNRIYQESFEMSAVQPQQDIYENKVLPESSYKNLNYTQLTENDENLPSSSNKVLCTVKPSKLKTPKSSFNIEMNSSMYVDPQENLSEFGPQSPTKLEQCKPISCTSSPIFDDKSINGSMFLDAVSPRVSLSLEQSVETSVHESTKTTSLQNILSLENIKQNLKQYDFPEDEEELTGHRKVLERFDVLQKRLKYLIKNYEFPKIEIVDLREMHKTASLTENSETSNNESSKPEQTEQRLSLHDTVVEESCRSKFWSLKNSENEDGEYYINTHSNMITLKVTVEKEKGKVYSIEVIKNKTKKNSVEWICQFTLNKIFLPKIEDSHLLSALGPNYDILTLLDYLNVSMEPIKKFVDNIIELQELHREYHLRFNSDYSITSEILDAKIGLWWIITIRISTLEILDDVSAKSETKAVEVSEQQIKSLAKNTPKGLDCVANFLSEVYAYYQRTIKAAAIQRRPLCAVGQLLPSCLKYT